MSPIVRRDMSRLGTAAGQRDDKTLQGLVSKAVEDRHSSFLELPLSQTADKFQGDVRMGDREWTIKVRYGSLFCDLKEQRSMRKP